MRREGVQGQYAELNGMSQEERNAQEARAAIMERKGDIASQGHSLVLEEDRSALGLREGRTPAVLRVACRKVATGKQWRQVFRARCVPWAEGQ